MSRALTLTALLPLLLAACVEEATPSDPDALGGFRVQIVDDNELGSVPYEFPSTFTPVSISVEALRAGGGLKDDYDGTLQVRVVPGEVDESTRFVRLENGRNDSHEIQLRYSFGNTRIWVEEVGLDQRNECRDGFDNDGNGRLDFPGDPGCFAEDDPSEGGATYVTGVSNGIDFDLVDIRNVQFNPVDPAGVSPLLGEEVVIERGELLVTNVTAFGFFVTDLEETEGYDSIFLFNFSFPDGVELGDRVLWFSGGVDEFQQDTQLSFPSWEIDPDYSLSREHRRALAQCETVADPSVLQPDIPVLTAATLADTRRSSRTNRRSCASKTSGSRTRTWTATSTRAPTSPASKKRPVAAPVRTPTSAPSSRASPCVTSSAVTSTAPP